MRSARERLTAGLLCALGAASFATAGCAHHPKVVAPAPALADSATAASDDTTLGRNAGSIIGPTNGASTATKTRRPPAKPPVPPPVAPEPKPKVVSGSSTSAPTAPDTTAAPVPIVPQLSEKEKIELERTSREDIDAATARLKSLDEAKLDADRQRKYRIAQGFVDDALAARKGEDWLRASQLATKARVLAEELAPK